jgi:hypothetical protein
MNDAAKSTTGDIVAHEISHDAIQWLKKDPSLKNGRQAIAPAMALVRPD